MVDEHTVDTDESHTTPLEFANCIQPHGILFAVRRKDPNLTILQVSKNVWELIGVKVEDVLGAPFLNLVKPKYRDALFSVLNGSDDVSMSGQRPPFPLRMISNNSKWSCIFYPTDSGIVVELEPVSHASDDPTQLSFKSSAAGLMKVNAAIERMKSATDVHQLFEISAKELRTMLGFDRVLLYCLSASGHGRVVAESISDQVKDRVTLYGAQFPARDIPQNAHCMFTTKMQRLIVDIDQDPSPLVPERNPDTHRILDLSRSVLRGTMSCHIRYVRNMLVKANFVNGIPKGDGKLWGLLIAHHFSAKFVPYESRASAAQLILALSVLIDNKGEEEYRHFEKQATAVQIQMLKLAPKEPAEDIMARMTPLLRDVMKCDGLAFVTPQFSVNVGNCPPKASMFAIAEYLTANDEAISGLWETNCTDNIPTLKGLDLAGCCGILALTISSINKEFLLWFRGAVKHHVRWSTVSTNEANPLAHIGNREAFVVWRQAVTNCSESWAIADLAVARTLRLAISDVRTTNEMRLKARMLEEMNRELANSNRQISRVATDLRQLLETVPLTVFSVDSNMFVTEWNPFAERQTGISKAEMMTGDLVQMLVEPSRQEAVRTAIRSALQGMDTHEELEFSFYRSQDKTTLYFSLRVAPRKGLDGVIVGAVGVCEDLTQKKAAAAAHERILMATAANEAKTQFLCSISHEMRTPLNGLLGMLQLAQDTSFAHETAENIRLAYKSGQHLMTVISDVLDMGQIEAGKVQIRIGATDLRIVLSDAVAICNSTLNAEKRLSIDMQILPTVPSTIMADADRLRQVLVNVLSNAIKYSRDGVVSVVADIGSISEATSADKESEATAAPGTGTGTDTGKGGGGGGEDIGVRIAVKDQGIGIKSADLKLLFTRFVRIRDDALSKDPGGTGLGLVICKNLVTMMGGRIDISSTYGLGTTVTIMLPLVPTPSPSTLPHTPTPLSLAATSASVTAQKSPSTPGRRLHILLAEDNEMNMKVAKSMMERQGHSVESAWTGLEALNAFTAHVLDPAAAAGSTSTPYDVILLDLEMPVMTGLEASKQIRQLETKLKLPRTPILALTAHVMQEQEGACYQAGMDGYITKPILKAQLFSAIENALVFKEAQP